MQRTVISPRPKVLDTEASPCFNVVIAYEDFDTGKHAKKTYDFLATNLGHECHFSNQMWKFDVLSVPKLREIAAKDAATADIIIVSCRGGELPDYVMAWIELWVGAERNHPIALVGLFDCPPEDLHQTRATRAYLTGVAKRGEMEFFAQPEEGPSRRESLEHFAGEGAIPRAKTLSALAGLVVREEGSPRWGINE
jgi:hypothetical protein